LRHRAAQGVQAADTLVQADELLRRDRAGRQRGQSILDTNIVQIAVDETVLPVDTELR